jgi:hypothetical protein
MLRLGKRRAQLIQELHLCSAFCVKLRQRRLELLLASRRTLPHSPRVSASHSIEEKLSDHRPAM